jgi:hypothetical protein
MTTLNLNKKSKGSYFVSANNIYITIENPLICVGMGSNAWQLVIEISENQVLNEYFPTKKEANLFAANWVNENL